MKHGMRQNVQAICGKKYLRNSPSSDLGITISKDLKWNSHINQAVFKDYRMLGFLRQKMNRYFYSHTRKMLYLSLIRSTCGYAGEV